MILLAIGVIAFTIFMGIALLINKKSLIYISTVLLIVYIIILLIKFWSVI